MTDATPSPIHALQCTLDEARAGRLPAGALAALWREHAAGLEGLPPRFAQVLEQLLTQIESGSLFTEESCSFSQHDQFDGLSRWLDHARQRLAAQQGSSAPR